jgi:hypothetical protein
MRPSQRELAIVKTTITIEDGDIRIAFAPESEIERMALSDLGDDVSVSRAHQSLVLRRRRANNVSRLVDAGLAQNDK